MSGASNPQAIVGVQLTATRINGAGVEMCSHADPDRTHYSLYLRHADGTAEWVCDYLPQNLNAGLCTAVKLSMAHQVPIERMQGLDITVRRPE